MKTHQEKVNTIVSKMKRPWPTHVRLLHLSEEMGELVDVFLAYQGLKDTKAGKEDLEVAMGGVFFDLISICSDLGIDVDEMLTKEIDKFWKFT